MACSMVTYALYSSHYRNKERLNLSKLIRGVCHREKVKGFTVRLDK